MLRILNLKAAVGLVVGVIDGKVVGDDDGLPVVGVNVGDRVGVEEGLPRAQTREAKVVCGPCIQLPVGGVVGVADGLLVGVVDGVLSVPNTCKNANKTNLQTHKLQTA